MAGAAASVSLTFGVALATLVVAGGIVAGPAIVECSRQPEALGACLRAKIDAVGTPRNEPPVAAALPLEAPTPAPAPRRPEGWLDVNATEYEALSSAEVHLKGPDATAITGRRAAAVEAPDGRIALAAPAGDLSAVDIPQAQGPTPVTSLRAPQATLTAIAEPSGPSQAAETRLSAPSANLKAVGDFAAGQSWARAELAAPPIRLDATSVPVSPAASAGVAIDQTAGTLAGSGTAGLSGGVDAPVALRELTGAIEAIGNEAPGRFESEITIAAAPPAVRVQEAPDPSTVPDSVTLHANAGITRALSPAIAPVPPSSISITVASAGLAAVGREGDAHADFGHAAPVATSVGALSAEGGTTTFDDVSSVALEAATEPEKPAAVAPTPRAPPFAVPTTDPHPPKPLAKPAEPKPAAKPAKPKTPAVRPTPRRIIKIDRRYPDVTVLPIPDGDGSSFATLQLR